MTVRRLSVRRAEPHLQLHVDLPPPPRLRRSSSAVSMARALGAKRAARWLGASFSDQASHAWGLLAGTGTVGLAE